MDSADDVVIGVLFCKAHVDAVDAAIDAAGMGPLRAVSLEGAGAMLERMAEGVPGELDFEPYFTALVTVTRLVTGLFDPRGLVETNGCPLCLLEGQDWTGAVVDQVAAEARRRGLIAPEGGAP